MSQTIPFNFKNIGKPNILYRNDNFLNEKEILHYQSLLRSATWAPGIGYNQAQSLDDIKYFGKDLYNHYKWDGDWDSARWADSTPVDWENLYSKIAVLLPNHYIHWVDVKITCSGLGGTPTHRDKDPWTIGGDENKFSRAITIICNLNLKWNPEWGGGFQLYETRYDYETKKVNLIEDQLVEISPGQLIITENCYHSIQPIVERNKSRISFILHVLEYKD